jgi:uncharacterized PurR-regulated membrane protein YhhQ (DUF165 family)
MILDYICRFLVGVVGLVILVGVPCLLVYIIFKIIKALSEWLGIKDAVAMVFAGLFVILVLVSVIIVFYTVGEAFCQSFGWCGL